jgi:hypothetical protein
MHPPPPIDLVVTRHPALIELMQEVGLIDTSVPRVTHVEDPKALAGKHVAGVLSLSLAAEASYVTEIPLKLTEIDRGRELSLKRLREIAGPSKTYCVNVVHTSSPLNQTN